MFKIARTCDGRAERHGPTTQWITWRFVPALQATLVVAFLLLLVAGCGDFRMEVGRRPNLDPLETSLRVGQSSSADVLAALGTPEGKGMAMLPIDAKPRMVWSYYYEEGSMKDDRRIFLFVFLIEDRYDGYMWFSSLAK